MINYQIELGRKLVRVMRKNRGILFNVKETFISFISTKVEGRETSAGAV